MSNQIGAAFVGTGFMGQVHTRAARANGARLVGLIGSSPDRGRKAAALLGVEQSFTSLDELLTHPGIDIVHVLTPNSLHASQAMQIMEAGKHVICEKPLATTVSDALALAAKAEDAGVVNAVPFVYRYHPMVREAKERLADRRVLTVNARYLQDWMASATDNWRVHSEQGGSSRAFADIGSHLVDMIEFVTGKRIVRLTARTLIAERTRGGVDVDTEDAAALLLELEDGAIGTALISQVSVGRKNQLAFEITTTAETIAFDQERPDDLWLGRVDGAVELPRDPSVLGREATRLSIVPVGHPLGYVDAFTALVGDAYAAVRGEPSEGLPTFRDGLRAVQLTECVLGSARNPL